MTKTIAKYVEHLLIGIVAAVSLFATICGASDRVPGSVASSHVEANVPAKETFDTLLKRDLETYFFKKFGQSVLVQYQSLRDGPTQSGVAYPKFYFWVNVKGNATSNKLAEGAIRIAAIEKKLFNITDFVSIEEIRQQPNILEKIFPAAVTERIKDHIN